MREPDDDLKSYLSCNADIFTLEEIKDVLACVPGHNDEDYWYWVIELHNGKFVLCSAWCDYTGWECQSGGQSWFADSPIRACIHAPFKEEWTGREIRLNLAEQLVGNQPYGLEVVKR